MAVQTIPISNGFYVSGSLPLSNQQCINWIPTDLEVQALSPSALFGTPGITQIATTGSAASDFNRGSWDLAGIPYFVNGKALSP